MFIHKAFLLVFLTVAISADWIMKDYQSVTNRVCESLGRVLRERANIWHCGADITWNGEAQNCTTEVKQKVQKEFEFGVGCSGAEVVENNDMTEASAVVQLCWSMTDLRYYHILAEGLNCGDVRLGGDFNEGGQCHHQQQYALPYLKTMLGCIPPP